MSLRERIEPEITGDDDQKRNRTELLRLVVAAFDKGGQELVVSELTSEMTDIETHFDVELGKLNKKL